MKPTIIVENGDVKVSVVTPQPDLVVKYTKPILEQKITLLTASRDRLNTQILDNQNNLTALINSPEYKQANPSHQEQTPS